MDRICLLILGDASGYKSLATQLGAKIISANLDNLQSKIDAEKDSWIFFLREGDHMNEVDVSRLKHLTKNPVLPPYLFPIQNRVKEGIKESIKETLGVHLFHSSARVIFQPDETCANFREDSRVKCEPHLVSIQIHRDNREAHDLPSQDRDEFIVAAHEAIERQDPEDWRSYYNKAIALTRLGRYRESTEALLEGHRINPKDLMILSNIGYNFMEINDFEKSNTFYLKALEINPNFDTALSNLGVLHIRAGDYEKATQYLRRAIKVRSDNPSNYYNLANSLFRLKNLPEAIQSYQQAIAFDPEYEKARAELAMALLQMNKMEQAKEQIEELEEREINFPQTLFNCAIYFIHMKESKKAEAALQQLCIRFNGTKEAAQANTLLQQIGRTARE